MKSDFYKNSKGEQIDFTLYVYQRPNMRNGEQQMLCYVGLREIEKMFDAGEPDTTTKHIKLYYPERWTNILELRAIPDRMLATFPNLEFAEIHTHSVYIVQCVRASHILVDTTSYKYPEKNYGDLNTRYCEPTTHAGGLQCFGGSVKLGA